MGMGKIFRVANEILMTGLRWMESRVTAVQDGTDLDRSALEANLQVRKVWITSSRFSKI